MLRGAMWRSGVEPVSQYSVVRVEAISGQVEVIFLTFECHDKQTYAKLVLLVTNVRTLESGTMCSTRL